LIWHWQNDQGKGEQAAKEKEGITAVIQYRPSDLPLSMATQLVRLKMSKKEGIVREISPLDSV
jgi:hypothetical protein